MAGECVLIVLSFDGSGSNRVQEASLLPNPPLDLVVACRGCDRTKKLDVPKSRPGRFTLASIVDSIVASRGLQTDTDELYALRFPDEVAAEDWVNAHAAELEDKTLYFVNPALPPGNP